MRMSANNSAFGPGRPSVVASLKGLALWAAVVSVGTISGHTQAAGDAAAGEQKSATCAACHGAQGVSQIPSNPILAGQYASYIEHALKSYRSGSRENAIMAGFATQLTDQDIADLAAYFSSLPGPLQTAPIE